MKRVTVWMDANMQHGAAQRARQIGCKPAQAYRTLLVMGLRACA